MNKLVILLTSLLVVACASPTPQTQTTPQENKQAANSTSDTASTSASSSAQTSSTDATSASTAPAAASTAAAPATTGKPVNEAQPRNESIYFDFDESIVKTEFREILAKQAANNKNHQNTVLVLEGNADERGSVAYNLALGERRATGVKKALVQLGVPAANLRVVSFGNTRAKLTCHEEKCWQENRRVDFSHP
jgi:peptidoglycan-associated lipoprotein